MNNCACALRGGCACDRIARLSSRAKQEIQMYFLRAAAARRKRAAYARRLSAEHAAKVRWGRA